MQEVRHVRFHTAKICEGTKVNISTVVFLSPLTSLGRTLCKFAISGLC